MYRRDGEINQSWHLDGFIAEQHHVESFNMEAAAQEVVTVRKYLSQHQVKHMVRIQSI